MAIRVGTKVPNFTVPALVNGNPDLDGISLDDYAGKWRLVFFYPLDFTFVCPTEIKELIAKADAFKKLGVEVILASTDSPFSHKAWSKDLGDVPYPWISDLNHRVSRMFGILVEEKGISLRGAFIINPDGVLEASIVHNLSVGRSADELLRVVAAFQTGENCPANWKPGDKTL